MITMTKQVLACALLVPAVWSGALNANSAGEVAAPPPPSVHLSHTAMTAEFDFLLFGDEGMDPQYMRECAQEAFDSIDAMENCISNWIDGSPTATMNREAGDKPVVVPPELFALMTTSRGYWEETSGVFDVTVGPLLKLWGFYGKQGGLPSPEEIKQSLELVGMNRVQLNKADRSVKFERPGMRVDFGGIGKGLAVDRAANILKEKGIPSGRISGGTSSIVAWGPPPQGGGWTVDIRDPYVSGTVAHPPLAKVVIGDEALSTSSNSEKFIELNGKKYGHIFDPRTGMPAETDIVSATSIAPTGTESDAITKAFFILGVEGARAYCAKHPKCRALLIVDHDGKPEVVKINFPE
jgi:thiamine biosynthesis lipoprotein